LNSEYTVDSVCTDPWAERISKYWKYLTGNRCIILLGKTGDSIILLKKEDPNTGRPIQGIVFEKPIEYPHFRNFIWHEAGHFVGEQSEDPIENEFLADKWAIDKALSKGFTKVAEEILLRCSAHCDMDIDPVYQQSSKKVLFHFADFAKSIIESYDV